jgi:uncharacterized membrane protein
VPGVAKLFGELGILFSVISNSGFSSAYSSTIKFVCIKSGRVASLQYISALKVAILHLINILRRSKSSMSMSPEMNINLS